jgi:LPXTG-site transpeptidase (sortase) family protein
LVTHEPKQDAGTASSRSRRQKRVFVVRAAIAFLTLAFVVSSSPRVLTTTSAHVAAQNEAPTVRSEPGAAPPEELVNRQTSSFTASAESPEGDPQASPSTSVLPVAPVRNLAFDRVRIPAIGVDAPIEEAGPPLNGQLQAPSSADSVVWYNFTAEPGTAGNVLLAGHVDLGRRTAVFWNLRLLEAGDAIIVHTSRGEATYVVERTYTVTSDTTDTALIIGNRSGQPTLTLITCDGAFVTSRHGYDQRRIVVASLRV